MTSSTVNPVVNAVAGTNYGEEPGPVDLLLEMTGLLAASRGVKAGYKGLTQGADAAISPISKDPMALAKGPIDRRNFLYRATGLPENKRVQTVGKMGQQLESNWNLAEKKAKLLPRINEDRESYINWDKVPDKLDNRIRDLINGYGGTDPQAFDAIKASPTLRDHFGMLGIDDLRDWRALPDTKRDALIGRGDELDLGAAETFDYEHYPGLADYNEGMGRSAQARLSENMQMAQGAKELREGKIWKPPSVVDTSPTFLTNILKRMGSELGPEVRQQIQKPVTDAASESSGTIQSILKRLGIK
jgi:hypothetical protein